MVKNIQLAIMLVLIPTIIYSEPGDTFIELAFKHSPVIQSEQAKARSAKDSYKQESVFKKNPVLNFGYTNIPVNEWPALDKHPMSGISIGISQFIAFPWESHYRKKTVYKKFMSEKESLNEAYNKLAFDVQTQYHEIMFLRRKKTILEKSRTALVSIQKSSEALVAVNKMRSSYLLRLRADIAQIDNTILEMDAQIQKAQKKMELLCGTNIDWKPVQKQTGNWIDDREYTLVMADFKYDTHPLYKKFKAQFEAADAMQDQARSGLFPGLTLGLEYRIRQEIPGKDTGENFISIKASAPVPLFYPMKDRHAINAKINTRKQMKNILEKIELQLKTQWEGEVRTYGQLQKVLINYRKSILPGYWAAYKAQIGSLAAGSVSLADVQGTYRMYLKTSIDEAMIYKKLMNSKLKLKYLLYSYPGKEQIIKDTVR